MDLVCTGAIFLKATMYVAISTGYIRMDSMENYIELDGETFIYCKQMNGKLLEFDEQGVLVITPDNIKT